MDNLYASLEEQYKLPSGLLNILENTESGGNINAVSPKGAKGLFGFMDDTAKAYNVDVTNKLSSAHGAAKFMSDLINQYGSVQAALAHYNGGTKSGKTVAAGGEAPFEETKNYLQKVNAGLKVNPNNIEWANPQSSVTVSAPNDSAPIVSTPNPSNIDWNETLNTSKMSNPELFKQGLINSAKNTVAGIGQILDPLALQMEKSFNKMQKETGGNTRSGRFMEQLQKTFGTLTAEEVAAQRPEEIKKLREENKAITKTPAGLAGNITGELAQAIALPGGTIVKTAGSGALIGASQPTIEDESRLFNTAAGAGFGAAGQGVVNAIGRVAQPVTKALGTMGEKGVQILKDAGVPLDAAQATGSKLLERGKAFLSDNPITAGAQHAFATEQKQAYNKAISRTFGEDADHITPEIIQAAKDRLGANYNAIASRNNIHLDDVLENNLSNIGKEAQIILNPENFNIVNKQISNIFAKADANGGALSGAQYQEIKTVLDKLSKSENATVGNYARELKDSLLDSLTRSAKAAGNKEDVALLKETNKQYGNMKKVENVADFSTGEISPSKLYNHLKTKSNRYSFYTDDPQLANLASAGKNILTEKLPNSGTAARLLSASVLPAALGIGEYVREGDLYHAGGAALAGVAFPKLFQGLINNPKTAKYLSEGIGNNAIKYLANMPSKLGAGKLPLAGFESYTQQLQQAKK
jgi:hypothetical protein